MKEISDSFDRRFLTTTFFPTLIFWGLALLLYYRYQPILLFDDWLGRSSGYQILTLLLFLGWVVFFSLLLSGFTGNLMRLYEGYWSNLPLFGLVLTPLAEKRKNHYQETLEMLLDDVKNKKTSYGVIYYNYPPVSQKDKVMPTMMGNTMKSVELYPLVRYNLDAVLIWPRLYHILPETFAEKLADAKGYLDMMLIVSFLSFCLGILGGIYLLAMRSGLLISIFTLGFGLLTGWLSYKCAVRAAIGYGVTLRSAFDLYHLQLIDSLGFEKPACLQDERIFWDKICNFYYYGLPTSKPADFPVYKKENKSDESKIS